jgi:formate dehydrogenase major subunit
MNAAKRGEIRGMYIMGENPAMSDPDVQHARQALAALDCLVVQDLFLTETASFADVILPASAFPEKTGTFTNTDRRVQLGRQALTCPARCAQDLDIIQEMASTASGSAGTTRPCRRLVRDPQAVPSCAASRGSGWSASTASPTRAVNEGDPGEEVIFVETVPHRGRPRAHRARRVHPGDELPDAEYPFVLITGRLLEHWHTGAMTRRAGVLDAIEPVPTVSLHPDDLAALGMEPGAPVALRRGAAASSRWRAEITATPAAACSCPSRTSRPPANVLTNPKLDPYGKIPEFKYCAVRTFTGTGQAHAHVYGQGLRVPARSDRSFAAGPATTGAAAFASSCPSR